jgi:hypothetical protein
MKKQLNKLFSIFLKKKKQETDKPLNVDIVEERKKGPLYHYRTNKVK